MLIELIQVALGHRERLSTTPTAENWKTMYNGATLQAVAGVCFTAIQKLPPNQRPPQNLYWEWLGLVTTIQQQNELMDRRTAEVWQKLKVAGLDAVVLKGQGVAVSYGELASFRQSGDIDIWVKGGYQTVCDFVQSAAPTLDVAYHRFHFDIFPDTEVELHHRPTLMRNLLDDRKLTHWYNSFGADSSVYLEDKGFAVPPAAFNRIFILTHIYRHFLFEGIGLRQVMDYYFVLKNLTPDPSPKGDGSDYQLLLKQLGLLKFAEALMWILHTQFGLPESKLICAPNEKEGRFVLDEIMATGNFGCGEKRYHFKRMKTVRRMTIHGTHLLLHYPSEVIWTPIWLIYHKVWKWNKKRKLRL